MATGTTPRPALSDEELQKLLELIKGADSVELKLTVPEQDQRSTVRALGLDPLQARDPPGVLLRHAGAGARPAGPGRTCPAVAEKGDDSVVKLRPVVPSELSKAIRRSPNFGVEVDALPGGFVCSGVDEGDARDRRRARGRCRANERSRKLFSKEQRALFAAHAPDGIALDDLSILGPIFVLKLKYLPEGFDRRLVAEMWLYPDGSRILELSTKCEPAEAFQVAAETRGVPRLEGRRSRHRAADEDPDGTRVLRQGHRRRRRRLRAGVAARATIVSTSTSSATRSPPTPIPPAGRTTRSGR